MVAALCARAQQYVNQPPQGEAELIELAQQLHNVLDPTDEEQGAIAQAFENIGIAFALIGQPDADEVRPPDQPFMDQLLPAAPAQEDEMDPGVQARLLQQAVRRAPPAQPRQGQAAAPQQLPAVQPRRIIAQPAAAVEPDLCTRILRIFTQFVTMIMGWISSCINHCFTPQATPQPVEQPPAPRPQAQEQVQPPLHEEAAAPQQQPVLERGVERGVLCGKAMALALRDHLIANRGPQEFPQLAAAAIAANGPANERVQEIPIPRLGLTQNYATEAGILELHAIHARINAALLTKGDEVHLLLTDTRTRPAMNYYHFTPYTGQIHHFDQLNDFVAHLQEAIPVAAETPFALQGLRIN